MTLPTDPDPQFPPVKSVLLSAVPSFWRTFKVLTNVYPLNAARAPGIKRYGPLVALFLTMFLPFLLIMAGDGAPFIGPYNSLWTYKFETFISPNRDWMTLIMSSAGWLIPFFTTVVICVFLSWYLNGRKFNKDTIDIALLCGYMAIAITLTFAATLLVVMATGWLLSLFKIKIFVLGWLITSAFVLLPIATFATIKIFARTPWPKAPKRHAATILCMTTLLGSAYGAIHTIDYLNETMLSQGHTVQTARSVPTSAVIQTCGKDADEIVCAVTLYPGKWQDYELIGEWVLGHVDQQLVHHMQSVWTPAKESDRKFAVLALEARKDLTVEISSKVASACSANGTMVTKEDVFFVVQGRVRGVQHLLPQKLRLRVDNLDNGQVDILNQACRLPPNH